jgi:hypothetical protein
MSRGRRPGRPPKGEVAATDAERQAAYQERLAAAGMVRVSVLVPADDADQIRDLAADLRDRHGRRLTEPAD